MDSCEQLHSHLLGWDEKKTPNKNCLHFLICAWLDFILLPQPPTLPPATSPTPTHLPAERPLQDHLALHAPSVPRVLRGIASSVDGAWVVLSGPGWGGRSSFVGILLRQAWPRGAVVSRSVAFIIMTVEVGLVGHRGWKIIVIILSVLAGISRSQFHLKHRAHNVRPRVLTQPD